jgi:DDE superfamily endonuclease
MLLACEPLRGWRFVPVRKQRTAMDDAAFMPELVATSSPAVERIQLVQDNLHTHTPGAFSHALAPQEAFAWAQTCTLPYTPIKGSWRNMAEIELSALARQGLDRRIGDMATLEKATMIWSANRNKARTTARWKLTKNDARRKLQKKYPMLQN